MDPKTSTLSSTSGVELFLRTWEPEETPSGALVIVHGLGEHAGRYQHVADHFTAKGLVVLGHDHVGFGKSGGTRGDVPSFDTFVEDTIAVAARARELIGSERPLVIYGHSMGGLISLQVLLRHPDVFDRAVITGPALDVTQNVNGFLDAMSKLLNKLVPGLRLDNGLVPAELCTDPLVGHAYVADPLVHRKASVRLFRALAAAGDEIRRRVGELPASLPILVMHGADDHICRAEETRTFFEGLPMEDKLLKIWPGMFHEIHNEKEQQAVFCQLDQFLGTIDPTGKVTTP